MGSALCGSRWSLHINDSRDDLVCNIAIYADNTTVFCKCDQASDLSQQLELATKLESDLPDTMDWDKNWFFDFNAGKLQLVCLTTGLIDMKRVGLEEKSCFKMLGLTFSYKLDWGSYIVSVAKTSSKKLEHLSPPPGEFLDKLQKQISITVGHSLAGSFEC